MHFKGGNFYPKPGAAIPANWEWANKTFFFLLSNQKIEESILRRLSSQMYFSIYNFEVNNKILHTWDIMGNFPTLLNVTFNLMKWEDKCQLELWGKFAFCTWNFKSWQRVGGGSRSMGVNRCWNFQKLTFYTLRTWNSTPLTRKRVFHYSNFHWWQPSSSCVVVFFAH